ncbi:hypothetical protein V2I01_20115 [Micromonospora sp. BRA006-A]|nr:hypothetical protein [Micromonospora sp. BRA006-A]
MSMLPSPIPHPLDFCPWDLPGWIYEALDWVVGVEWPEGDERAVWNLADQWYGVAGVLTRPRDDAITAAGEVKSGYGGVGLVAGAFDTAWHKLAEGEDAPLRVLVGATGELARLVDSCGCDIEGAKLEAWIELGILVVELLSLAVATVLTLGAASPAAAAAITATRVVVQQTAAGGSARPQGGQAEPQGGGRTGREGGGQVRCPQAGPAGRDRRPAGGRSGGGHQPRHAGVPELHRPAGRPRPDRREHVGSRRIRRRRGRATGRAGPARQQAVRGDRRAVRAGDGRGAARRDRRGSGDRPRAVARGSGARRCLRGQRVRHQPGGFGTATPPRRAAERVDGVPGRPGRAGRRRSRRADPGPAGRRADRPGRRHGRRRRSRDTRTRHAPCRRSAPTRRGPAPPGAGPHDDAARRRRPARRGTSDRHHEPHLVLGDHGRARRHAPIDRARSPQRRGSGGDADRPPHAVLDQPDPGGSRTDGIPAPPADHPRVAPPPTADRAAPSATEVRRDRLRSHRSTRRRGRIRERRPSGPSTDRGRPPFSAAGVLGSASPSYRLPRAPPGPAPHPGVAS